MLAGTLEREGPVEPKKSPAISFIVRHESTHLTRNSHDFQLFSTLRHSQVAAALFSSIKRTI
jgi:hypothetical protein